MNGPTIVYVPDYINDYQLAKIKEFNEEVKRFNSNNKEELKVCFEYHNKEKDIEHDLDDLLNNVSLLEKAV